MHDLSLLTNLEILKVMCSMDWSFFEEISQLTLKHMWLTLRFCEPYFQKFPPTLTSLALHGGVRSIRPADIPTQITHLQLLNQGFNVFNDLLLAGPFPAVTNLDLHLVCKGYAYDTIVSGLHGLGKMTALESLGLSIHDWSPTWNYERIASVAPDIAGMSARGVRVRVVQDAHELHGVFSSPWQKETTWATVS